MSRLSAHALGTLLVGALGLGLALLLLLLDDCETLVVHLLSGGSFVLNSAALREAGATCTVEIRRFVAFKLGVMPYQVHLLDGFRLLSDDDSIFQSPLSVAVASSILQ